MCGDPDIKFCLELLGPSKDFDTDVVYRRLPNMQQYDMLGARRQRIRFDCPRGKLPQLLADSKGARGYEN